MLVNSMIIVVALCSTFQAHGAGFRQRQLSGKKGVDGGAPTYVPVDGGAPTYVPVEEVVSSGKKSKSSGAVGSGKKSLAIVPSDKELGKAAKYCEESGGVVEVRGATFNTNSAPYIWLGRYKEFCTFTQYEVAEDFNSTITVDTWTMYTETPTIASMAYYSQVPLGQISDSVNPAAIYCLEKLYGSSSWGNTLGGGGWVTEDGDISSQCMFPDGSSIDVWGLLYYAQGFIRGKNLTEVFRFDVSQGPAIY